MYIIATNKELANIVSSAPKSLEALRLIQGFGQKKTQRHGQEILEIVRHFTANASEQPEAHSGREDAGDGN